MRRDRDVSSSPLYFPYRRRTVVGKSLGPYKIIDQLGKGGMGEVWLAEDTRLDRKVAVKVLPGELAGDADRRSRFEQESKAAAALNHPHIAAIHDVGVETAEGETHPTHYMVQEYLQGETLREAIARGTLSFDKAVALCIEIGEALKAAHRAGIVHRDLKPDNVFVTQDGHAKVLDFGLAKLTEIALPSGVSGSASPTMTTAGQMLGTAGYMAPEQVRGEDVDERVDLFALGCLLYEAVSGNKAFGGDNLHESLSRVLSGEPDPVSGTGSGHAPLNWILGKLLQKDREQRYQSAGDVVVDLRRLTAGDDSFASMTATAIPETVAPPRRSWVLPVAVAVVALLAGALLGGRLLGPASQPASAKPNLRFDVMLGKHQQFTNTYNRVATLSPDARAIAYTATGGIWVRFLDLLPPELVPDTEGARGPAFSADGRGLTFWSDNHIKRFTIGDSASVILTPFPERPMGIHWSADGFIYIGRADQGIWRVSAEGGEAEQVLAMEDGELAHGPEPLADGEWILFTLGRGVRAWDDASIVAHNLVTHERRVLVQRGREVRVARSGHLLYVHDGMIFAAPFDADSV
jgi:serine/threonine-protein kinase